MNAKSMKHPGNPHCKPPRKFLKWSVGCLAALATLGCSATDNFIRTASDNLDQLRTTVVSPSKSPSSSRNRFPFSRRTEKFAGTARQTGGIRSRSQSAFAGNARSASYDNGDQFESDNQSESDVQLANYQQPLSKTYSTYAPPEMGPFEGMRSQMPYGRQPYYQDQMYPDSGSSATVESPTQFDVEAGDAQAPAPVPVSVIPSNQDLIPQPVPHSSSPMQTPAADPQSSYDYSSQEGNNYQPPASAQPRANQLRSQRQPARMQQPVYTPNTQNRTYYETPAYGYTEYDQGMNYGQPRSGNRFTDRGYLVEGPTIHGSQLRQHPATATELGIQMEQEIANLREQLRYEQSSKQRVVDKNQRLQYELDRLRKLHDRANAEIASISQQNKTLVEQLATSKQVNRDLKATSDKALQNIEETLDTVLLNTISSPQNSETGDR